MTDTILNAKSDYKILPPITGPAIERLSHKFIKDLKEKFDEHARFQKEIEQRPPPAKLNSINIVKGSAAETKLPSQKGKSNDLKHSLHEAGEESQASNLNRRKDTKKLKNSWVQVEESLIIKGAVDALQNSLNVTTVNPNDLIDVVSNLACITIESPKFSGYLITAMGKNKKIDGKFVKKIQQRLIKFLKESGEEISEDQNMDLEIKQVPFEDWALEYAEFMRKSVHNGSEVAMAFFPRKDIKTILETSYDEKMAALKIDEIQGNSTVNFNLYIRLPRNNKYVLYTPRGGIFYEDQKGRLESRGVSDLHIMKEDLEKIDKYRAEKFLNEKIQEFEENERQNGPPIKQKKAVWHQALFSELTTRSDQV